MKKTIFLTACLIVFLGMVTFFVLVSPPQPKSQEDDMVTEEGPFYIPGQSPTSTPAKPGDVDHRNTFSIMTEQGGTIFVRKFLDDPDIFASSQNEGYYFLGNHHPVVPGISDPPYVIGYIASTQYFNCVLLQEPVGQARAQLEQYLIAKLGIPSRQLCDIRYTVSVPADVNDVYAGRDLGFSFCPGATAL